MSNTYWLLGMQREILADGSDTDERYDLIATISQSGRETPPHVHQQYTETEYVLEGELTIYTDTEVIVIGPGQAYTIAKGQPHALSATGKGITKLLTVFSPAGFSKVIRLAGKRPEDSTRETTDLSLFNQLSSEIGDVTLGPIGMDLQQYSGEFFRRPL
ncbi:cupin domain-containing protein [Fibrisoma limi]|uniref:cupin domain-containing protein n=1 Tax=Fibrisoma limi TaxID=663275 RepID=UPI00068452EC|nr:cupin domain-containing protein [Fibrisoma limi]